MSDPKLPIGSNHCLCSGCGRYFTTVANFDAHRKGKFAPVGEGNSQNRRCVDPSTIKRKNGSARYRFSVKGLWASPPTGWYS